MKTNIIPFPPSAAISPRGANSAGGAACRPAAISYSALGNPPNRFDALFDPVAFEAALYQRELNAVAVEMAK